MKHDPYALERLIAPLVEKQGKIEREVERLHTRMVVPPTVARYMTAAGQSIANNTTTVINFGTAVIDTHSRVTVGAAWKFTASIGGYYRVSAAVLFAGTTTWALGEAASLNLYNNGGAVSILDRKDNFDGGGTQFLQLSGSDVIQLVAGDLLDIRVLQGSGAALSLHTDAAANYISIVRLT